MCWLVHTISARHAIDFWQISPLLPLLIADTIWGIERQQVNSPRLLRCNWNVSMSATGQQREEQPGVRGFTWPRSLHRGHPAPWPQSACWPGPGSTACRWSSTHARSCPHTWPHSHPYQTLGGKTRKCIRSDKTETHGELKAVPNRCIDVFWPVVRA